MKVHSNAIAMQVIRYPGFEVAKKGAAPKLSEKKADILVGSTPVGNLGNLGFATSRASFRFLYSVFSWSEVPSIVC